LSQEQRQPLGSDGNRFVKHWFEEEGNGEPAGARTQDQRLKRALRWLPENFNAGNSTVILFNKDAMFMLFASVGGGVLVHRDLPESCSVFLTFFFRL
jgi:hypothetical protein